MRLSQLSAKPVLVQVILDDKDIVDEYGESLEFYTWDRQPMNVFMKLASIDLKSDSNDLLGVIKTLILDEEGKEVITNDNMLPAKVLMRAITKISELLGK